MLIPRLYSRIKLTLIVFLWGLLNFPVHADFAWLPKNGEFDLKVGGNYYFTDTNFNYQSSKTSLLYNEHITSLSTFKFFVEPEFSPAPGFSTYMHLNYLASGLSNRDDVGSPTVLTANGLGDVYLGVKANVVKHSPTLTVEANVKIPTYSYYVSSFDQLLQGDGNVDVGLLLHAGFRLSHLFFDLSPGLLFRFSGYSSAFTLKALAGGRYSLLYGFLFANLLASFSDNPLFDSSLAVHDAPGAGGSYALLGGGPTVFSMGVKAGVEFIKNYSVEAYFEQAVAGHRAADFVQTGLNLAMRFDLNPRDTRTKIHEIPFDREQVDPAALENKPQEPKATDTPSTDDATETPEPPPPTPTTPSDSGN